MSYAIWKKRAPAAGAPREEGCLGEGIPPTPWPSRCSLGCCGPLAKWATITGGRTW
jgi:hypothetical protein